MSAPNPTLYVVLLRFSKNEGRAAELMAAHNAWIARGLEERVFLVVGSLQPQQGGAIVAHNTTRAKLEARILEDPFVLHDVVQPEILELAPSKTDPRLAFLLG